MLFFPIMGRLLAIGDIHGCRDKLEALLRRIAPETDDTLVFLGDYIDRGPDPRGVIDELLRLRRQTHCVFLRGNHEDMFLNWLEFGNNWTMYTSNGGLQTIRAYAGEDDDFDHHRVARSLPGAHRNFFADLQDWYEHGGYIFVHAGIRPGTALAAQSRSDLLWIRNEFIGIPTGVTAKVIFGHTPFPRPLIQKDKIGIDTGAVYGGMLTAIELPQEQFIQTAP